MKILTDTGLMVLWNKIKQLVLGNRPYNPSDFSGKGYKVLEKNIQAIGGVKKNILTEVMLSEANTIYEIRYDFDLGGETIEMKEGCTLKFNGGSISNGVISFNNTNLQGNILIYSEIRGNVTNSFVDPIWFGLCYNNPHKGKENVDAINKAIILASNSNIEVIINDGTIYIDAVNNPGGWMKKKNPTIVLQNNSIVKMGKNTIIIVNPNDYIGYYVFSCYSVTNVQIIGGTIIGDIETHTGTDGEQGHGISIISSTNIIISDIVIKNMWGDGIILEGNEITNINNKDITINNVKCLNNRRQGLSLCSGIGIKLNHSSFNGTGSIKKTAPSSGIDIEPGINTFIVDDVTIDSCELRNNIGDENSSVDNANISGWHNSANKINSNVIKTIRIINCDLTSNNGKGMARLVGGKVYLENCKLNGLIFVLSDDDLGDVEVSNSTINYIEFVSNHFNSVTFNSCIFNYSSAFPKGIISWTGATMKNVYFNSCIFRIKDTPLVVSNWAVATYSKTFYMFNPSIVNEGSSNFNVNYHFINMINPYFLNCKISQFMKIDTNNNAMSLRTEQNSFSKNTINFDNVLTIVKDDNDTLVDAYGFTSDLNRKGLNGEKPIITKDSDKGFLYYNTSYKKFEYWDGNDWKTIPSLPFVDIPIMALKNDSVIITSLEQLKNVKDYGIGTVFNIVYDIDLKGENIQFPYNSKVFFTGAVLSNGTINANTSLFLPTGLPTSYYYTSNCIVSNFKSGQTVYDFTLEKMKLWNGSSWVSIDGSALS